MMVGEVLWRRPAVTRSDEVIDSVEGLMMELKSDPGVLLIELKK